MRPRCLGNELTCCCAVVLQVVKKESKPKKKEPKLQSSPQKGSSAKGRPKGFTNQDWLIERYLVRWWYCEEWPPADRPKPDDLSKDFIRTVDHRESNSKSQDSANVVLV